MLILLNQNRAGLLVPVPIVDPPPIGVTGAIADIVDGLYDGFDIFFYSGVQPAFRASAIGCTLLFDATLDTPAAEVGDAISATSTNIHVTSGYVYVEGTVTWARILNFDNVSIFDCAVNTFGSPFLVNNKNVSLAQLVTVITATATEAAGILSFAMSLSIV